MKYFVDFVIRALVDFPDEVDIEEIDKDQNTLFLVRLNPADIGKVIGKNGRTISAIRSVLNAAATKANKHVALEIADAEHLSET